MARNNDKDLAQKLLDLGSLIDEAKTEKSEFEGRKKNITETLKKKYNCSTVEEARELLDEKTSERNKKINTLRKGIEELEDKFE